MPRSPTSTPTTRYQPSSRASSISFARTQPRAVDVDQLPVEDVLAQQHLLRPALERPQVEPVGREA